MLGSGDMEFVVLKLSVVPPNYSAISLTNFTIGSRFRYFFFKLYTSTPVSFNAGDVIGILGYRNGVNSYGVQGNISIDGQSAPVYRFIHQGPLSAFTTSSGVSANSGSTSISRVNFSWTTGASISSTAWTSNVGSTPYDLSSTTSLTPTCTATTTQTYTLTATNVFGCSASDNVTVNIDNTNSTNSNFWQQYRLWWWNCISHQRLQVVQNGSGSVFQWGTGNNCWFKYYSRSFILNLFYIIIIRNRFLG